MRTQSTATATLRHLVRVNRTVLSAAAAATLGVTLFLIHGAKPVAAQSGSIIFYEGNGAKQDRVQAVSDLGGQSFRPVVNDEARSLRLENVRRNCVIFVYDDPRGRINDDWTAIRVKRFARNYVVRSFERSYEDEFVKVEYHRKNGLDGKVSYVGIR